MADDLKDMLKKVLTSAGKKTFFFAYGPGKRKDKKGEGELAVGGKKPKKAEIEAELADTGEFYEGICWTGNGPDNGGTVYFQGKGKKLSAQIVTKMAKTAKLTAGRQYDFQLPSPEEEARVAQLTGGEDDETRAAVPPAQPVEAVPPAPPQAAVPPAPPPPGGAEVIKRLNAMTADVKTALAGPNKARVQSLFVAASSLIKNKDFVQARQVLDELEPLVKQPATATAPEPPAAAPPEPPAAPPPPPPAADGKLAAEWERRMIAIEPKVLNAQKTRAGEAKWMTLFEAARDLGSEEDFAKALGVLNKLESLLNTPAKAPAAKETSFVAMQAARLRWDDTRKKVHAELVRLEKAIMDQCVAFNSTPGAAFTVDLTDLKTKSQKLYTILDKLDERLIDTLDEALNAQTKELRQEKNIAAVAILKEYQGIVNSDPFLAVIDDNGFAATSVKQTFVTVLADLSSKL
jgi:hypothetical protein